MSIKLDMHVAMLLPVCFLVMGVIFLALVMINDIEDDAATTNTTFAKLHGNVTNATWVRAHAKRIHRTQSGYGSAMRHVVWAFESLPRIVLWLYVH